jgi:lambda family phage tail tape measure protein
MAARSLGTLTLDLVAKTGNFVQGMDKAARSASQRMKEIQDKVEHTGKAVGIAMAGASAAAVGFGVASFQMLKQTSDAVAETDKWAKSLGVNTQALQQWQYAAGRAGLEGDKIADIFKDLNDKIGEAASLKSGEAVDALNALGLSSEKLAKLSPDKQLLAIAQGLGKISTTAQKTTILESLGDDLSRMLPLLDDGGKKLNQYMQQAKDFGIALDPKQIDDLVKANEIIKDLEDQLTGIKNEFSAGLASVDISPLTQAMNDLRRTVTDPKFVQGVVDISTAIVTLTTKTANAAGEFANFAKWMGEAFAAKLNGPALDDLVRLEDQVSSLTDELEKAKAAGGMPALFDDFGVSGSRSVADIQKELDAAKERLRIGRELADMAANNKPKAGPVTDPNPTVITGDLGGTNGPSTAAKIVEDAGQKRLDNLRQQNAALQAQYDSIDAQTGKVVTLGQQAQALAKWEQELATLKEKKTLTAEQKSVLASADLLTAQYKRNAALEKEVDLRKKAAEEAAKLKAFQDNLNNQLDTMRQDQAGSIATIGMGSEQAQRFQEMLSIRQQFEQQQNDLLGQYNSGDISKDLYDEETEALSDALQTRLELQQDYYKQLDDAQSDWRNGASEAFADYFNQSTNVAAMSYDAFNTAFSGMNDALYNFVTTGKLSFADLAGEFASTALRMLIQWGTAQVAMAALNAFTSTAAIPIVGPLAAPAAAASALGSAGSFMGMISSVAGMAHDGIDSVPEDGTWLLQKGERVTTAETSAKLDKTLSDIQGSRSGHGDVQVINNGQPVSARTQMDGNTLKIILDAVEQDYVGKMTSGTGRYPKAVESSYGVQRRGR